MKLRMAFGVAGVFGVLALVAMSVQAATSLPYAQGFESGFAMGDPWTTNGGGTSASSAAAVLTGAGTQGLLLSNDTATLDIINSSYTNTWIQVYARPVVGSSDPAVSGVSGAFYLTSGGGLRAYTGAWVTVASGLATTGYKGFIVHADYANDTWDLYYTEGPYKTNMTLANTTGPLLFTSMAGTIDNVSVASGDAAHVDAVAVSPGKTSAGESGDKVGVYEHPSTSTAQADFTLPVYASRYTSPAGAKSVSGALGNDILSGLVTGDRLYVWTTNDAFSYYDVNASGALFAPAQSPTAPAVGSMFIYSNTRMMLDPTNSPRRQTFGFYAYSNATVYALNGQIQPSAAGATEAFTLNGTSGGRTGYTALNWPDADTIASCDIKDPDADLSNNDRLFVSAPATPNAFTEYWWNNTAGLWYGFNGQPASASIQAGSKMWVRRQGASDEGVTVTH